MTLFSIFRAMAALIFVLCVVVGVAVYDLNAGYKEEQQAIRLQRELKNLGEQLAQGSDYLTGEIRRYVQFGDPVHHDNFWREVHETRSRDKAVERLKELNVLDSELSLIEKAKEYSDKLIKTEEAAMAAVKRNDLDRARQLVFGPYYDEQKALIMGNIKQFQNVVNARASQKTQELMLRNTRIMVFTNGLLLISGVLVVFGFYGIGIHRLIQPLNKATHLMLKLAREDADIEIPAAKTKDEIGAIYSALRVFRENSILRKQAETNLNHEQALKELLQVIAISANESRTLEEVAETCLQSVCLTMGWPVGHLYVLQEGSEVLIPSKVWYVEDREKYKNFIAVTESTPMLSGVGLPGRVLATQEPVWIKDVTQDNNFPRFRLAKSIGVRAGFAFPVVIENKTVAVLEFFSGSVLEPDERLLESMKTIGIQVGRVVEREQTEKKLETLVRKRTRELEESNTSLKDFVNIASHDLKEPLRKIVAFGDVLQIKANVNDLKGKEYIERLQSATKRMGRLLDDLLDYSRVNQETRPFEWVDINRIVQEIRIDLESRIAETKGTVRCANIPGMMADPVHIRHLLQNLISNSLKYHKEGVPPVVEISSRPSGKDKLQIIIQDNGIGFDEKYIKKIFMPFERLHGKGKFSGTGIGLAICKKIIDRHNGTIEVQSRENEGSRFILTFKIYQCNPGLKVAGEAREGE